MPLETTSIAKSLRIKGLRIDDEVQFIRSWLEKPLSTGAVMPSGSAPAPDP
jgi:phosphatidylethanolamine/phosphatidyl-N-methylethanolamine N-methyltransferase